MRHWNMHLLQVKANDSGMLAKLQVRVCRVLRCAPGRWQLNPCMRTRSSCSLASLRTYMLLVACLMVVIVVCKQSGVMPDAILHQSACILLSQVMCDCHA